MKILYVGDVMGKAGREVLAEVLPQIKKEFDLDFVIVQAENSHDNGKSPNSGDVEQMQLAGADFFTGGNHSFSETHTTALYETSNGNIIRPLNVDDKPGEGYRIVTVNGKRLLIASILGQTVGAQRLDPTNPLFAFDQVLENESGNFDIAIVNFHGDFSSEKVVFGHYYDGKVTAVIGDHWHVPTADARLLPKGTAHITDVGMCGALNASLGVKLDVIIERWLHGTPQPNTMELSGARQFNALLVEIDDSTNKPLAVERIGRYL